MTITMTNCMFEGNSKGAIRVAGVGYNFSPCEKCGSRGISFKDMMSSPPDAECASCGAPLQTIPVDDPSRARV